MTFAYATVLIYTYVTHWCVQFRMRTLLLFRVVSNGNSAKNPQFIRRSGRCIYGHFLLFWLTPLSPIAWLLTKEYAYSGSHPLLGTQDIC